MSEEEYDEIAPLDIQIEILKRLPIKSVLKFRSVSKTWKSIIQSSRFITDYNNNHVQPHQIFVGYDYEHHVDVLDDDNDVIRFLQRLTLNMSAEHPDLEFCKLIGHSHGLFGIHCYSNITSKDVVVIWNPSIRKSIVIPLPKRKRKKNCFEFTVCNATDPTIVNIIDTCVEIFRLSTGVWRTLCITRPRKSLVLTSIVVVIDRVIHWFAYDRTLEGVCLHNLILSFDTTSEQFSELRLPPTLAHTPISSLEFSKLRESVVVLEYHQYKQEIGVWMMMMMKPSVQNSFTKLYTLKLPNTILRRPSIMGFRRNGQPIIARVRLTTHNRSILLFYKHDLEHFNDVKIFGSTHPTTAGAYMETLLLLDH